MVASAVASVDRPTSDPSLQMRRRQGPLARVSGQRMGRAGRCRSGFAGHIAVHACDGVDSARRIGSKGGMTAMFVTATGADVGKTFVARGIIRELRTRGLAVDALKPVITGYDAHTAHLSDTGRLLAALGRPLTPRQINLVSPFRLREPLPPDHAARVEGRPIDFNALSTFCRTAISRHKGALLIEGIGGIMVPLGDRHTVLDWMIEIDLPAILVTGSYVGALSHALTALDVLERNALKIAAVVVNESPGSAATLGDTADTIRRFTDTIDVFNLPRLPDGTRSHPVLAALADLM
jgi:dethiobiotin synthetase